MNAGYFILSPNQDGFGFGQIIPPLSQTRGKHDEYTNSWTGGGYRHVRDTGTWWIVTDVVDNGGGSFTVSGDYVSNLMSATYENGFGQQETTSGVFKAVPLMINNRVLSAYIPVPVTINNVVTTLGFNSDKSLNIAKGSVTFAPYINGGLFTQDAIPSINDSPTPETTILAIHNLSFRSQTRQMELLPRMPISNSLHYYQQNWTTGGGTTSSTSGIYYKAITPCAWSLKYGSSTLRNVEVGLATDMEQWLANGYNYPSMYQDMTSANCYCCFDYQSNVPDYIEYV